MATKSLKHTVYFDRGTKERIETRARDDGMSFSEEVNELCNKALSIQVDSEYLPFVRQALRDAEDDLVRRLQGRLDIACEVTSSRVIDYLVASSAVETD